MRARFASLRLAAAVLLFAFAAGAFGQAGRVVLAVGEVSAQRGAERLRIVAGASVAVGDTIVTGAQSHAQIRFADDALVAIKPDTEFRIEQFAFAGQADGGERAVFRLVRGGFRTVTGQVGQVNRDTYRVLTTQATIGIRGTHYVLQVCGPDECRDNAGGPAADAGLYCGVLDGRVAAVTTAGEFLFDPFEFFVVPGSGLPQRLVGPPTFLADRLVARAQLADKRAPADLQFPKLPKFPVDFAEPDPPFTYQATEDRNNGAPFTVDQGFVVGSDRNTLELGRTTPDNSPLTVADDGTLRAVRSGGLDASIGTASIVDTGRDTSSSSGLNWGRWNGPGSTIRQQLPNGEIYNNDGGNLHYVYGNLAVNVPTSGTVSFGAIGGTRPTDSGTGATGTLISGGTVTIDFTAARLSLAGLAVGFTGATYTLGGTTSLVGPYFSTSGVGGNAACTGAACQPLVQGNFTGFLAGPGVTGVGLDYYFSTRTGSVIEGASAYRRCTGPGTC